MKTVKANRGLGDWLEAATVHWQLLRLSSAGKARKTHPELGTEFRDPSKCDITLSLGLVQKIGLVTRKVKKEILDESFAFRMLKVL